MLESVKVGLGVFGLISAMYWSVSHAGFGLTGMLLGQQALDWANVKMSLFNAVLPYIVFVFCFAFGVYWIVDSIRGAVKKNKHTNVSENDTVEEIKRCLSRAVELIDKIKS